MMLCLLVISAILLLSTGVCSYRQRDWNVIITNQSELDLFVATARLNHDSHMCINLSLVGNSSYTLDIVDFMNVTSFSIANNGSLIMQAIGGKVEINCVSSLSDLEELLQILQPISNALLVMLNGFVFNNCPVPVLIEEVSTVTVQNCVFQHHQHGALNIFNSPNVTVKNCTFYNNTSSSFFTRRPFQGNAGGLSIAYNIELSNKTVSSVNILVTGCDFIANHAAPPTALRLSSTEFLAMNIIVGRGGALAIPINVNGPVSCVVTGNMFINNSAATVGGSIYGFTGGAYINNTSLYADNVFIGSSASIGGVMSLISSQRIPDVFLLHITIQNCTFINNRAGICGCVNYYPHLGLAGDVIKFIDSKFYNNSASLYAGAIDIVSYRFFGSRVHQEPIQLTNCEFDGNTAPSGAALNLAYYNARMDNVSFRNHHGSAVRVISGVITLNHSLRFYNNDAEMNDGGALHLISFSQIFTEPETHLDFVNNTGRFGAAIVAMFDNVSPIFERTQFNPLCFFQYSDPVVPSSQWDNVTINFAGNQALVGSAIYTNGLNHCSWVSYSSPYFSDIKHVLRWPLITYGDGNLNIGHSDSDNTSLAVQTPPVGFNIQNKTIAAYPGQPINISIFSYDEQHFTTPDTLQIKGSNYDSSVSIEFSPSAKTFYPHETYFTIRFSVKTSEKITNKIFNENYLINISALRTHSIYEEEHFNLTLMTCPPGLALYPTAVEDEYECKCDDDNDQNIVRCLPHERRLILKEGYWTHDISFGSLDGVLEYYRCPPGYCQCSNNNECNSVYYYDDNDLQCVCDRQGYLCGECRGDKGFSVLLNKCVSCGYVNTLLIAAIVIADVIVILAILLSSITLQSWLYPFLFYIQVTPHIAEYFPMTFSAAQPYLYYISSALSLYFPYDFCLYPGMSAVASYSFRYIPFILTIIIFSVIYIVCSKSTHGINVNFRLLWAGLWLLIMLQFTNVVTTSVSILNCPLLKDFDGKNSLRWYIDGTVECFTGGHAILATFAILVLIVCVVLIAIVTAITVGKIEKPSIQRVLQDPYTNDSKWFAPFELARRLLPAIFISIDPGNLAPVLLLIMIYLAVYAYVQPYQKFHINILETLLLVVILLMLIIVSTGGFEHSVFGPNTNFDIDQCGHVNMISIYAVILIPFYYFPLVLLALVVIKKIGERILSIRSQQKVTDSVNEPHQGDHSVNTGAATNRGTTVTFTEICITNDNNCLVYHNHTTLN